MYFIVREPLKIPLSGGMKAISITTAAETTKQPLAPPSIPPPTLFGAPRPTVPMRFVTIHPIIEAAMMQAIKTAKKPMT
jgi:hypothetical protein